MRRAGDKMKMLEQRIGQRRDATRALAQVPTGWGCPTTHTVGQKAVNPRGMGTASPFQKSSLPNSKKMLTKGGESWSAADAPVGLLAPPKMLTSLSRQRVQGDPRGPGGPPHRRPTGGPPRYRTTTVFTFTNSRIPQAASSRP